ncbi:MAG: hypothetical protein HY351_05235 [Candidatus Omnitrophica bacterium]|nr:hypothetical protein [Candidatus Omnitrophota bacterium]
MEQPETPAKLGIKIERPAPEKVNGFYSFLLVLSFLLIAFAAWLLFLEWSNQPIPAFLKLPIYE